MNLDIDPETAQRSHFTVCAAVMQAIREPRLGELVTGWLRRKP